MKVPEKCPRCSKDNEDSSLFCGFCGSPLAIECPYCRERQPAGTNRCMKCGEPLKVAVASKADAGLLASFALSFRRSQMAVLIPVLIFVVYAAWYLLGRSVTMPPVPPVGSPQHPHSPATLPPASFRMGWPMTGYDSGNTYWYPLNSGKPVSLSDIASRGEFTVDNGRYYAGALTGDVDGDGKVELVFTNEKELILCDEKGAVKLRRTFEIPVALNLLADTDDDGIPEIVVSGSEEDRLVMHILKGKDGKTIKTMSTKGTIRDGKPDSGISAAAVVDLEGDGKKEVLAMVNTGYGWKPRGVYVFDYESGDEKWHYSMGPSTVSINAADINKDGELEVIVGSYSPGNGNSESNGTDDMHCYVFALDCRGKELWKRELGGYFTGTRTSTADIDGDGRADIVAFISTAFDYREDEGKVVLLDPKGEIAHSYETPYSITSNAIADMDGNGRREIIAGDRMGNLVMLNEKLEVLKKFTLQGEGKGRDAYFINIQAAADVDGCGLPELICNAYEYEVVSGRNPRSDGGPRNVRYHHHNRVLIIDGKLERSLKSFMIAELWKEPPGFRTIVSFLEEGGENRIIVLSDRVNIFGAR
jgi:outer membrane protein assembly factor BamB